ncbi:hypothetical protein ONE63_002877 [Megalurothrips usitatus]|uniref:Protein dopey-1 homolog n=1 Tax=Megalurothrips usitatus TaxID=439358 RepID=A0AAV7X9J3_9NEOP|nr:hypothetical protein ONE63_002877 [Megalurothrips usitatus]
MEEYELMKDSKYRVYVSAVDKALKNFDYTSEWADLISALGKLNKVLSSYMKFQVIPRRIKISLFPLLGHAAMNVRPSLLTVYETHFVPLGERLCPALSGFLSGVLPGLEEGSDHFERTNILLEKVCDGVGAAKFYTCLWDCLSSNSTIRLPAICFILAHFNRKLSTEDQLHIMGTDIDVMVNGLCTAVQDSSVLVQRSALDLLLVGFPLHNSQLVRSDMIRLVTASLITILRRDMSLNRRLFAWLLGSEVNLSLLSPDHPLVKSPAVSYFQLFSQEMLVQAIRTSLNHVLAETPHDLKPFRILVSLLDKPEIGPVILDYILYEVFRTLYLASLDTRASSAKIKDQHHIFSLEPAYIWQYAGSLVERACRLHHDAVLSGQEEPDHIDTVRPVGSGQPCLVEVCLLVSCLLDAVPLESYIDTTLEHLPNLFLHIVNQLCSDILFTPRQLVMCLQLCSKILSRVQPQPSVSKLNSYTDPSRQRSKTVSFHQRRNSDSSQTLILEGNVDRLKDLSRSDHHLETDTNSKLEISNRSASVGARLEADQDTRNEICSSKRQSEVTTESPKWDGQSSPNLILDECRKKYQELFVRLITSNRLVDWQKHDYNELFHNLVIVSCSEVEKNDTSGLEKLLKACLTNSEPEEDSAQTIMTTQVKLPKYNSWKESGVLDVALQLEAQSAEWEEVFGGACTLLVDLSTFPSFCQPAKTFPVSKPSEIPTWLKLLTVCCCWLGQSPMMQQTAIATLLDLIGVASKSFPHVSGAENNQVTTVVLTPLLYQDEVQTLENCTCVMQVIAHWLWHHLNVGGALEARSVALLQQLHDTVTAEDIVESTIGEFINQDDEEGQLRGFQSFTTLWHASREIANRGKRPFLKSLLRMLDNLALPDSSPLKLAAQSWLLHTLLRGDIPRLLDPLLLPLLAPTTARVSVLRVSIQHRSTVLPTEADKAESRIYAISSEDGNVIYHVSPVQSSAAILSALRMQGQLRWLHQQWTTLVTCSLPFMGQSLAHVVLSVVRQLCDNLRSLAPLYANTLSNKERSNFRLPADYTVTQLEALTILCHYCLLDRNQQHALNQPLLSASAGGSLLTSSSGVHGVGQTSHAAQIFSNLVHVFMTTPLHQDAAQENIEPQLAARRALLYNLPQIISSTTTLWKAATACTDKDQEGCSIAGNARIIRHHLLEFLSPISLHHASNFLAAIAVVWQDRRQSLSDLSSQVSVTPQVVPEQQVLVDLVSAIRAMPVDTLVQTLHQLVKSPPSVHGTNHSVCLEVSALELLLCYLRQGSSPPLLLAESWTSVLLLLRNASLCKYSIQAQTVLAEQLASLLDVTFGSQEKEKVVNILTSLLYNILPYLRNHSPRNSSSFYACSELVASVTAFQYTRKAWRRDMLDLLLEPALFQMEARALPHWRTIIDNLMSHDTTTFRDLMSRVSLGQGNSLSLFSSREQEYEQRAHLLKRLAFVILCGEMDQYQKYMPEIQERLAESLRLPQVVPAVQANVFLCFRVLLLRMSPHHVTSLWPVIISEMVQVFLQMEQELSTESEEFRFVGELSIFL